MTLYFHFAVRELKNKKKTKCVALSQIIHFFFSQESERAGILNPRIWLANLTHVTGPAFYDTAHGPDFFPAA